MTDIPDVLDNPYKAATWLIDRHEWAEHLITQVDAWTTIYEEGVEVRAVDVGLIAEGLNAYDRYRAEWEDYTNRVSPPYASRYQSDEAYERACDEYDKAGPKISNPFASRYAPMSSGEHRLFRMIGVLSSGQRVRFNIGDASVSLQCCSPATLGGPRPHTSFDVDWAMLISGAVVR